MPQRPERPARYFVTGTDTGVGKTEVAAALLTMLVQRGYEPKGFKPFQSGSGDDGELLWQAAGRRQPRESVTAYQFRAALAPGMAARLEKRRVNVPLVAKELQATRGSLVVEGAGGLFVPLDARHDVLDFLCALRFPVVVVARAGLGTVNHTSLTLEMLRARRQRVALVVLMCTDRATGDASVRLNAVELARRYPKIRFAGPMPFIRSARRRREHLVKLLEKALPASVK